MNKRLGALIRVLTTERLLLFIFFLSAANATQGYAPDVYLHLTTGRYILEIGELSHTDVFSFTHYGEPWVMHEWLYQVILYLIYETFGIVGLQVVSSGILTIILYINKQNCKLVGATNITAWLSTIILFLTWILFVGSRPHILTYLFFTLSLYFILLHRQKGMTKQLYIIPVLMMIWVNSHGGFIVGIVLLGYVTLLSFIEHYAITKQWEMPWHLFNSLILSIIASLINPYGVQQLLFPFSLMHQWAMEFVPEWMPPDFSAWHYMLYAIIVAIFAITSLREKPEKRWFNLFLATPFIIASLNSVRHVPLAAFIISPYFAANLSTLASRYLNQQSHPVANTGSTTNNKIARIANYELGIAENVLNWTLLCCFLCATYLTLPIMQQKKLDILKYQFPVDATEYLIKNNIHGRMFSTMQYSNYILFHRYPEQKIFYDVRIETYGTDLTFDYMRMVYAQDNWVELFRKYKIDYIVLSKVEPDSAYHIFAGNSNFDIQYEDETSIIFSLVAQIKAENDS